MTYFPPSLTYPFILALLVLIFIWGNISMLLKTAVGVETVLFLGYLIFNAPKKGRLAPMSNIVGLFPGHLLLLVAMSFLSSLGPGLFFLWMLIPAASAVYDYLGRGVRITGRAKKSILAGLYCIIWADVFFLLERIIVVGRGYSGLKEIILGVVLFVIAGWFLSIGAYRHLRGNKF